MTTEWTSEDLLSASVGPLLLRYYEFYYQKLSSLPEEVILARAPRPSSACKRSPRRPLTLFPTGDPSARATPVLGMQVLTTKPPHPLPHR